MEAKYWAVFDVTNTDTFITTCKDKAEAVKEAQEQWNGLTAYEKRHRQVYAGSTVYDPDDEYSDKADHDVYDVAWDSDELKEVE